MKGQDQRNPILARPTVRAILDGPCSETIGGWARPLFHAVEARTRTMVAPRVR